MSFERFYEGEIPTEIQAKNTANTFARGGLCSFESHRIVEKGWELLLKVPFDSKEADIIVAGIAIWGRAFEDRKYHDKIPRFYPQKSLDEIFEICFDDEEPWQSGHENIIKRIGHAALVDQTLAFDGIVPLFSNSRWRDRDRSDLTDRFKKYNLPLSPSHANVKRFFEQSSTYTTIKQLRDQGILKGNTGGGSLLHGIGNEMSLEGLQEDIKTRPLCDEEKKLCKAFSTVSSFTHHYLRVKELFADLEEEIEDYNLRLMF